MASLRRARAKKTTNEVMPAKGGIKARRTLSFRFAPDPRPSATGERDRLHIPIVCMQSVSTECCASPRVALTLALVLALVLAPFDD